MRQHEAKAKAEEMASALGEGWEPVYYNSPGWLGPAGELFWTSIAQDGVWTVGYRESPEVEEPYYAVASSIKADTYATGTTPRKALLRALSRARESLKSQQEAIGKLLVELKVFESKVLNAGGDR